MGSTKENDFTTEAAVLVEPDHVRLHFAHLKSDGIGVRQTELSSQKFRWISSFANALKCCRARCTRQASTAPSAHRGRGAEPLARKSINVSRHLAASNFGHSKRAKIIIPQIPAKLLFLKGNNSHDNDVNLVFARFCVNMLPPGATTATSHARREMTELQAWMEQGQAREREVLTLSAHNFQSANDNENQGFIHSSEDLALSSRSDGSGPVLFNSSDDVKIRKRGRPRTLPWHQRRRIVRKAVTRVIADPVVTAMMDGAEHASVINAPLNTFVTLRPANIDRIPPEKRSDYWQVELNRIRSFVRHHGGELTCIWARESRVGDGTGEHLHLLMHLRRGLMHQLRERLLARYPGPREVDVRPGTNVGRRAQNGKYMSATTYLVKALSPSARRRSNQIYRKSGPVVGKRAGMTRNISVKAVASHRAKAGE